MVHYESSLFIVEITRLVCALAIKGWVVLVLWPKPFVVVKVTRRWRYFGGK